jgi:hypothetical protein
MDLLTRNKKEKSVYADGGSLSIFSDGAAASGIFAYALMTRLGIMKW